MFVINSRIEKFCYKFANGKKLFYLNQIVNGNVFVKLQKIERLR